MFWDRTEKETEQPLCRGLLDREWLISYTENKFTSSEYGIILVSTIGAF